MKQVATIGIAFGLLVLALNSPASASEGVATLSGAGNTRCFVASVLIDEGSYQVVVTCRNLIVPASSDRLFYRAWALRKGVVESADPEKKRMFEKSNYLSLGDISSGKLTVRVREAFTEVFITSESESSPKQPSADRIVASGEIGPINFGSSAGEGGVFTELNQKPTDALARVTATPSQKPTAPSAVSAGSVVATAFRLFLVIVGVIVIAAIVISILQRRSASH